MNECNLLFQIPLVSCMRTFGMWRFYIVTFIYNFWRGWCEGRKRDICNLCLYLLVTKICENVKNQTIEMPKRPWDQLWLITTHEEWQILTKFWSSIFCLCCSNCVNQPLSQTLSHNHSSALNITPMSNVRGSFFTPDKIQHHLV